MEKKTETGIIGRLAENPMAVYDRVAVVPQEALKQIGAGRLKGMSDINPMWRIKVMTQTFGMCGIGWKYEIARQWTEAYGDEVKAFCNVNLYVRTGEQWSEPMPGTGGASMVSVERNGKYVNDEAHKMALTDALSVAMKALGVGASVYFGKDADYGTKYAQQQSQNASQNVMSDILKAVAAASTRNELAAVWNKYPACQKSPEFVAAVTKQGEKLKSQSREKQ